MPDTQIRYWAFLSYSHADEKWAAWLHHALERYRIPDGLDHEPIAAAPRMQRRIFPVFRDREELASSADLPARINDALQASRSLIVICSPRAAASKWVAEEIRTFQRLGHAERILCLIVDGEPHASQYSDRKHLECFPEPVLYRVDEAGNRLPGATEPLAADARETGDGKRNALIKLVAGVLGVGLDVLKRREDVRQRKYFVRLGVAALLVIAGLAGGLVYTLELRSQAESARDAARAEQQRAEQERDAKERQRAIAQARQIAAQSQLLKEERPELLPKSLLLAIESMQRHPSVIAEQVLREGEQALLPVVFRTDHRCCALPAFSNDGAYMATQDESGRVSIRAVASRQEANSLQLPSPVYRIALGPEARYLVARYSVEKEGSSTEALYGIKRESHYVSVWDAASGKLRKTLGPFDDVVVSGDARWIAGVSVEGETCWKTDCEYRVTVWNADNVSEVATLTYNGRQNQVSFGTGDNRLLIRKSADEVVVWDFINAAESVINPYNGAGMPVLSADNGRMFFHTHTDHKVMTRDMNSGSEHVVGQHDGYIQRLAVSADAAVVVSGGSDRSARSWDAAGGRQLHKVMHQRGVEIVALSADGARVVSGGGVLDDDHTLRVWQAETGRELGRLVHAPGFKAAGFSPDGRQIVTVSPGETLFYTPDNNGTLASLAGDDWYYTLSEDGRRVATLRLGLNVAGEDGKKTLRIWDTTRREKTLELRIDKTVGAIIFSPDGNYLALNNGRPLSVSSDQGKTVWVIRVDTGAEVARFELGDIVQDMDFSPDSRYLAVATGSPWGPPPDFSASVWDIAQGRETARYRHRGVVYSVEFFADGKRIASASDDGTAVVWGAASGQRIAQSRHENGVRYLAISPDGQWLASSGQDETVRIWNAGSGVEQARLFHDMGLARVLFSPDGKHLAMHHGGETRQHLAEGDTLAVNKNTLRILELETHGDVARLVHGGSVSNIAYSRDGHMIVTGSADNLVRVWSTENGRELARLRLASRPFHVSFMPDGKQVLLSSTSDGVKLWQWDTGALVESVCTRLTDNLSHTDWQAYFGEEPYRRTCSDLPVNAFVEDGRGLARDGDIDGAVAVFRRALELAPGLKLEPQAEAQKLAAAAVFRRSLTFAIHGEIGRAVSEFERGRSFDPDADIRLPVQEQVCWYGAVWERAGDVLALCDQLVSLNPDQRNYRAGRGIARATRGDIAGALEDFETYLGLHRGIAGVLGTEASRSFALLMMRSMSSGGDPIDSNIDTRDMLSALENGENPFTPEVLEKMRNWRKARPRLR